MSDQATDTVRSRNLDSNTRRYRVEGWRLFKTRGKLDQRASVHEVEATSDSEACCMAERADAGKVAGVDWYFADVIGGGQ